MVFVSMPVGRRSKAGISIGAVALGLALGGCGGSESTSSTTEDGAGAPFAAAVEGVSIPDDAVVAVQWADTARLREAAGLSDDVEEVISDSRWRYPVGLALGEPLSTQILATDFGFDPMAGERTLTLGVPPQRATLYQGVDTEGAQEAFTGELGYEDEGEFLTYGDEGENVIDAGNDSPVISLLGMNRVGIEGDDLAIGAFEAPVAAALGREGQPLGDVDGIAATSDCLGSDAIAAQVDEPDGAAAPEVALQAVGVETPGADDVVPEVVCAIGAPGESLDGVRDCMDGSFNDGGVDPANNLPYEDELGRAEISEGEVGGTSWVRATFEPPAKEPVGKVFLLAANRSLSGPLGGDPLVSAGPTPTPQQLENLRDELPDAC